MTKGLCPSDRFFIRHSIHIHRILAIYVLLIIGINNCSQVDYLVNVTKCEQFYNKQYQQTALPYHDYQFFGCAGQFYYHFGRKVRLIKHDYNVCCPTLSCQKYDNVCEISKIPVGGKVGINYKHKIYHCNVWLRGVHKALSNCNRCFLAFCQTLRACYDGYCF